MALDLNKLLKFAPLVGVYAFYNVFATNYPSDPIGGMRTALTAFMADPIGKLQSKMTNITNLAIVIIGVPLLLKMIKVPTSIKALINLVVYYVIGDQIAATLNGAGRFGAVSSYSAPRGPSVSWGGETSSFHQNTAPAGVIKNIYGG